MKIICSLSNIYMYEKDQLANLCHTGERITTSQWILPYRQSKRGKNNTDLSNNWVNYRKSHTFILSNSSCYTGTNFLFSDLLG